MLLLEPARLLDFRKGTVESGVPVFDFFSWFVTKFVRGSAGRKRWSVRNMLTQVLSDVVGLMDEAFAILLFEICYDRWLVSAEVARGKKNGDLHSSWSEALPKQRYTKMGAEWTREGLRQYQFLHDTVKAGRAAGQNNSWERKVLRQAGKNNPISYEVENSDGNGASGCDDGAAYNIPMGGIYGESSEGFSFESEYELHDSKSSNSTRGV